LLFNFTAKNLTHILEGMRDHSYLVTRVPRLPTLKSLKTTSVDQRLLRKGKVGSEEKEECISLGKL
jgi:hypothetical protein